MNEMDKDEHNKEDIKNANLFKSEVQFEYTPPKKSDGVYDISDKEPDLNKKPSIVNPYTENIFKSTQDVGVYDVSSQELTYSGQPLANPDTEKVFLPQESSKVYDISDKEIDNSKISSGEQIVNPPIQSGEVYELGTSNFSKEVPVKGTPDLETASSASSSVFYTDSEESGNSDNINIYGTIQSEPTAIRPTPPITKPNSQYKRVNDIIDDIDRSSNPGSIESFSADDLYARRAEQKKKNGEQEEELVPIERVPLPEHPFFDRFFWAFFRIGFLVRFAITAAIGIVPFTILLYFLSSSNTDEANLGAVKTVLTSSSLPFLAFFWGIFSFPYFITILEGSSNGDDDFVSWPELNPLALAGLLCWIVILTLISGIPGAILATQLSFAVPWGIAVSAAIFLPPLLLSTLNNESQLNIYNKKVFISFKKNSSGWISFYILATILFFLSLLAVFFARLYILKSGNSAATAFSTAIILSIALTAIPAIYLRYLGRLAWIIDDTVRKAEEEEENDELS